MFSTTKLILFLIQSRLNIAPESLNIFLNQMLACLFLTVVNNKKCKNQVDVVILPSAIKCLRVFYIFVAQQLS